MLSKGWYLNEMTLATLLGKQRIVEAKEPMAKAYILRTGGFKVPRADGWYSGVHRVSWPEVFFMHNTDEFKAIAPHIYNPEAGLLCAVLAEFDSLLGREQDVAEILPYVRHKQALATAARLGLSHAVDWLVLKGEVAWSVASITALLKSDHPLAPVIWQKHLTQMQTLPRFDSSLGCSTQRVREAIDFMMEHKGPNGIPHDPKWLANDWKTLSLLVNDKTRPEDLADDARSHLVLHGKRNMLFFTKDLSVPIKFDSPNNSTVTRGVVPWSLPVGLRLVLFGPQAVKPSEVQEVFEWAQLTPEYDELLKSFEDELRKPAYVPRNAADCHWYLSRGFNVKARVLYDMLLSEELVNRRGPAAALDELEDCILKRCLHCKPCSCVARPGASCQHINVCDFWTHRQRMEKLISALLKHKETTAEQMKMLLAGRGVPGHLLEPLLARFGAVNRELEILKALN